MLKNFNALIKNIIVEQAETPDDEQRIKNMYHCNEFYNKFLCDLALDNNVNVSKSRNNAFLVVGSFKDVIKFFNNLKVDSDFMDKPKEFEIYQPTFTFNDSDYQYKLHRDDQYMANDAAGVPTGVPTTHGDDNIVRNTVYGRWFDFYEKKDKGQKLLKVVPNKFKKYIKEIQKEYNCEDKDIVYIEFTVNCEQWKNNIFDAEYRTEDDINELGAANGDDKRNIDNDFDYSQCVVPKSNDDSHRATLKNVKVTKKTYKDNKIK